MRYRLRTLLIVLALGPVALAGGYWMAKELISRRTGAEFGVRQHGPDAIIFAPRDLK